MLENVCKSPLAEPRARVAYGQDATCITTAIATQCGAPSSPPLLLPQLMDRQVPTHKGRRSYGGCAPAQRRQCK